MFLAAEEPSQDRAGLGRAGGFLGGAGFPSARLISDELISGMAGCT